MMPPAVADSTELAATLAEKYEADLGLVRRTKAHMDAREARLERLIADLRGEAEEGYAHLFEPPPPVERIYIDSTEATVAANGSGPSQRSPGTGDAIVAVLDDADKPLRAAQVYERLRERDWLPSARYPRNAVRTALWNLAKAGRIESLGDAPASRRWAAKTSSQTPKAPEGGGSVS
jgi:hypothetical protein